MATSATGSTGRWRTQGFGIFGCAREPITFHDLRHTFATIAVQIWPLSDVQAYLGHSNIATTMRYVHHVPKTDAAQKASAFIAAQMCPEMFPEPTVSGQSETNSA